MEGFTRIPTLLESLKTEFGCKRYGQNKISCQKLSVLASLSEILTSLSESLTSSPDSDINPYEVLGVNPLESFDKIKTAYSRKSKDAERREDEATLNRLEKAYDKVMMAQLSNRKKGLTFGSFQVSKDIKYADKQPIVPWGPRFTKSSADDTRINMAISALFTVWIVIKREAEWKPLQFLAFVFVYRIFEKLKSFEPQVSSTFNEEGEDEGRGLRMAKRLLRSLCLVFGSIAIASVPFSDRMRSLTPLFLVVKGTRTLLVYLLSICLC
ncbi:Protein CHLOROPLAST J-LIKE DOMAIN 1 [Ranunculus cassubicifolius]